MPEAIRTASPGEEITLVTDGNPSYPAGIHLINQKYEPNLTHKKVVGLQNLDKESGIDTLQGKWVKSIKLATLA